MTEPSRAIITQPELARLQRIEAKLREVARECGECGGTGMVPDGEAVTGRGPEDVLPNMEHCPECADIREALAAVTP